MATANIFNTDEHELYRWCGTTQVTNGTTTSPGCEIPFTFVDWYYSDIDQNIGSDLLKELVHLLIIRY